MELCRFLAENYSANTSRGFEGALKRDAYGGFHCPICNKVYDDRDKLINYHLRYHMEYSSKKSGNKCVAASNKEVEAVKKETEEVKKESDSDEDLGNEDCITEDNKTKCGLCGKVFYYDSSRRYHEIKCKELCRFLAENSSANTSRGFKAAFKRHADGGFICPICSKVYEDRGKLINYHLKYHLEYISKKEGKKWKR